MSSVEGPITFFDVETTGLSSEDRIVSLGIIHLPDARALKSGAAPEMEYIVVNPGRPSHPKARKVHGFTDDFLSQQQSFSAHAPRLAPYFKHGGLVVAHNASFDRRFITTAFKEAHTKVGSPEFFCTMLEHRRIHGSPSGLDAVIAQMGQPPRGTVHGALADAWHCMQVFCWLQGYAIPDISAVTRYVPGAPKTQITPPSTTPIAAAPPTRPARTDAFHAALQTLEPLATIMVRIGSADGALYNTEVEALSLLMHTTLSGMPGKLADHEYQDLLATLVELPTSDDALRRAARAIVRSREMREAVAGWVRTMTFADGTASAEEHREILAISDALKDARQAIPGLT